MGTPRFCVPNWVRLTETLISAADYDPAAPPSNLRSQRLSKRVRSPDGTTTLDVVARFPAPRQVASVWVAGFNWTASAVLTLQYELDAAWITFPDVVKTSRGDFGCFLPASVPAAAIRVQVADPANLANYVDLGVLSAGPYVTTRRGFSWSEPWARQDLGRIVYGAYGAQYPSRRPSRWTRQLSIPELGTTDDGVAFFNALLEDAFPGASFFLVPDGAPDSAVYGYFQEQSRYHRLPSPTGGYALDSITFAETID